jgi:hypothetical protein
MKKRILTVILTFAMVIALVPAITVKVFADGMSSATALTSGERIRGIITETNTTHWYSIRLTQAGRLSLNITSASDDGIHEAQITLYDSDDFEIFSTDSGLPNNWAWDLEAGTYYIRVRQREWSEATGTYNLTATVTGANKSETGRNDARGSAFSLSSDEKIRGFISQQNKTDWYSVELSQAGRLSLNINSGSDIGVYEASITIFDRNDFEIFSTDTGLSNSWFWDLEAGAYYIRVRQRTWSESTGTYILTATFPSGAAATTIQNNTRESAHPLSSGEAVRSLISVQNTVDWYSIRLPQAGRLSLNINSASDGGVHEAHVTLFDSENFEIFSTDSGLPNNWAWDLEAGTYYIRVRQRQWSESTGTYILTASLPLTTADALTVLRAAVGLSSLSAEQLTRYSITGTPATSDALRILRIAVGL